MNRRMGTFWARKGRTRDEDKDEEEVEVEAEEEAGVK